MCKDRGQASRTLWGLGSFFCSALGLLTSLLAHFSCGQGGCDSSLGQRVGSGTQDTCVNTEPYPYWRKLCLACRTEETLDFPGLLAGVLRRCLTSWLLPSPIHLLLYIPNRLSCSLLDRKSYSSQKARKGSCLPPPLLSRECRHADSWACCRHLEFRVCRFCQKVCRRTGVLAQW